MSKQISEDLSSKSPTLSIDFRNGSVVMRHGTEEWLGLLPMTSADRSQINTPGGLVHLEKNISAPLPEVGG